MLVVAVWRQKGAFLYTPQSPSCTLQAGPYLNQGQRKATAAKTLDTEFGTQLERKETILGRIMI